MPEKKPPKLSEAVQIYAPEGTNDRTWFTIEHQLIQAKISIQLAQDFIAAVAAYPENDSEKELAQGAAAILNKLYLGFLASHSAYLSYLSDSDVNERVGKVHL